MIVTLTVVPCTHQVSGLAVYSVVGARCGANHCLAVDQWGSVFSWGRSGDRVLFEYLNVSPSQ